MIVGPTSHGFNITQDVGLHKVGLKKSIVLAMILKALTNKDTSRRKNASDDFSTKLVFKKEHHLSRSFFRDIVQTREGEPRCASRPMVRVERKYFYSLISLKLRGESSYLYNY